MKTILKKPAGKRTEEELDMLAHTLAETKFFVER